MGIRRVAALTASIVCAQLVAACAVEELGTPLADDSRAADTLADPDSGAREPDAPETIAQEITGLEVDLLTENPTCARVQFQTAQPAAPRLTVVNARSGERAGVPAGVVPATSHDVTVMGLVPGADYMIEVAVGEGVVGEVVPDTDMAVAAVTTPVWPRAYPDFTFSDPVSGFASREGGYRMLHIVGDGQDVPRALLVVLDGQGDVRWFYVSDVSVSGFRRTDDGDFIVTTLGQILRLDATGRVRWRAAAADLGLDALHHDLAETEAGHVAVLSTELRRLDGYPDGVENVVGDVLAEIRPPTPTQDAEVVNALGLLDVLDPLHTTISFYNGFWNTTYPADAPTRDWSHANGLQYVAPLDSYLLTLRHLDMVILVDRATQSLRWRLGPNGDFVLTDGRWFYHPHAAHLTQTESPHVVEVVLFDNGVTRPLAEGEDRFSRAVAYRVDTQAMTATQTWEFRGEEPFYAPIYGDADPLTNGDVLVTQGAREAEAGPVYATVSEVTRDSPPVVRWSVTVRASDETPKTAVRVFQSDSVPALYPGQ